MKIKRILKRHIGHWVEWQGAMNKLTGKIVRVANRIATIEYHVAGYTEVCTHYMQTDSPSIVEIY